MTYKEFYDTVVYAMLNGDSETLDVMHGINLEWFVEVHNDIFKTLQKYTMFGVDD